MSCRTLQPLSWRHMATELGDLTDLANNSGLAGLSPIVCSSGLIAANGQVRATQITGIDDSYSSVSALGEFMVSGQLSDLHRSGFGLVLGDGWRIN